MSTLIENLRRLNRKERFFLIGMALGKPDFGLDAAFRERLSAGFGVAVPDTAFVAMDYHLNWIYAAAALAFGTPIRGAVHDNASGAIDGTQEDVDLLVAFEDDSGLNHLIMLEAKGVTPYSNRQFEHKMSRLRTIFRENGSSRWPQTQIRPYFGLASPRNPVKLRRCLCPDWLRVNGQIPWLKMTLQGKLTVFRCDEEGRPNKESAFWTTRPG